MKKFHFAPIHFVMLGVISFGILAVLLRAFGEGTLVLLAAFLVVAFLVSLLIYQQKFLKQQNLNKFSMLITMQKIVWHLY